MTDWSKNQINFGVQRLTFCNMFFCHLVTSAGLTSIARHIRAMMNIINKYGQGSPSHGKYDNISHLLRFLSACIGQFLCPSLFYWIKDAGKSFRDLQTRYSLEDRTDKHSDI